MIGEKENVRYYKKILSLAFIVILSFSLFGCQSEEDRLASEAAVEASIEESIAAAEEAARLEKLIAAEAAIIDLLETTPALNGWALTLAEGINGTFHNYDWDFEPYEDEEDVYIVTFTGNYSPNPRDLPQLSYRGSVSWIANVAKSSISLYNDPDDISSAFILLALPY